MSNNKVTLTALEFAQIYSTDYDVAVAFYQKYFGFEIVFTMPDGSCWGEAGKVGIWIGGGYTPSTDDEQSCRATVMFGVDSAKSLFNQFSADGVSILQEEPQEMRPGYFWFQFKDPSGNIIEILGGE